MTHPPPDPPAAGARGEDPAGAVLAALAAAGETLVLAESCTGGLAAASLVAVPGASDRFAGSFVTYQSASKAAWLAVPAALLEDPGPVSREVAAAMAAGVLERTPHATVAAAVTGHLGPDAPPGLDGVAWVAVRRRGGTGGGTASGTRPRGPARPSAGRRGRAAGGRRRLPPPRLNRHRVAKETTPETDGGWDGGGDHETS